MLYGVSLFHCLLINESVLRKTFQYFLSLIFIFVIVHTVGTAEQHDFQAETRMLLDIVAKSLYSENEVIDLVYSSASIILMGMLKND